jgi:hypothetical protein
MSTSYSRAIFFFYLLFVHLLVFVVSNLSLTLLLPPLPKPIYLSYLYRFWNSFNLDTPESFLRFERPPLIFRFCTASPIWSLVNATSLPIALKSSCIHFPQVKKNPLYPAFLQIQIAHARCTRSKDAWRIKKTLTEDTETTVLQMNNFFTQFFGIYWGWDGFYWLLLNKRGKFMMLKYYGNGTLGWVLGLEYCVWSGKIGSLLPM